MPTLFRRLLNWKGELLDGPDDLKLLRGRVPHAARPIRRHASRPTWGSWRSSSIEQPAQISGPIAVT